MAKLISLESRKPKVEEAVRVAVGKVVDANLPFVMVAKRPDGTWETSCHLPPEVTDYEITGVLYYLMNHDFMDDGED